MMSAGILEAGSWKDGQLWCADHGRQAGRYSGRVAIEKSRCLIESGDNTPGAAGGD
jgi:hypothetical protein